MLDWNALVRQRVKLPTLSRDEQDETLSELANHLEDLCAEYRGQGLSESAAIERAQSELSSTLARNIQRAKREEETMNPRTKQIWLPGLVSLSVAMLILMFEVHKDLGPWMYAAYSVSMPIYPPWLLSLPLCGALGAYLCRLAGGNRMARLTTASFPALTYFVFFALVFVITRFGHHPAPVTMIALVYAIWVFVPAAASLLGALPFLPATGRKAASHA